MSRIHPALSAFAMSARRMVTYMNELAYYEPAVEKLAGFFKDLKDEECERAIVHSVEKNFSLKKEVCLSGITYQYPDTQKTYWKMLGLLEPQSGKVLADGVDVRGFYERWLSCVGYIPQMVFMLDDSIRGNIAFGVPREEIDDAKVWEALEETQLAEFVRDLIKRMDTEIGERGVRLSGG